MPLIVRWPGTVPAGIESSEPVSSIDFFPTFQALSGQKSPGDQEIDGINLLPHFVEQQPLDREALHWHYPHYHHGGASPHGVIRKGSYRLIEHFDGTPAELYDLENDIGETVNLAYSLEETKKELLSDLRQWRQDVGAQMPVRNPDYDPDRGQEALFYHQYLEQKRGAP